jgi:hypothetical protein
VESAHLSFGITRLEIGFGPAKAIETDCDRCFEADYPCSRGGKSVLMNAGRWDNQTARSPKLDPLEGRQRWIPSVETVPGQSLDPGAGPIWCARTREVLMAIIYNVPITFGRNGTAKTLNCSGIDFSEDGAQSWTCAPIAELEVQLPPARQEVLVQIEASPFIVPGTVQSQQVFIFLGGMLLGFCKLMGHGVRAFPVNRSIISGRANRMSLVLPNATAPSSATESEDMRELGIYLNGIVFKTNS